MNPGGPGGSGVELLTYDPVPGPIAAQFDLVSWDPRGVGRSTGFNCGSTVPDLLAQDPDPDTAAEAAALEAAAASVSAQCGSLDGDLLLHMRTEDTARDLEAIRVALGSAPLNYLGYSYGTHIGLSYAAIFPENVSKMVLDGVVDPEESFTEFLLGQTAAFDAALVRQAGKCRKAGQKRCGVKDLLAAYDKVRAKVELRSLHGAGGPVGPAELAVAAITSAYQPEGWKALGPALSNALVGDGTAVRNMADSYQDMASYVPYAAVVCTDGPTPRGADEYRRFTEQAIAASPRLGGAIANELLPCATWPTVSTDTTTTEVHDIPPILLIANTGDPATPLANAQRVHSRTSNSVLVEVGSDGHTAVGRNDCVNRLVEAYLIESRVPSRGMRTCR